MEDISEDDWKDIVVAVGVGSSEVSMELGSAQGLMEAML